MSVSKNPPPQSSLLLRIFCGGYLLYLAWDMRSAISDGPLFVIPILIFAVAGIALVGHSIWVVVKQSGFSSAPTPETNSNEEMEDETNE